jgi:acetoin utilization deacetylase AcuC-like enzyme
MGFCLLNNAAIGAKYAQEVYGISKVAVLDFDVHHGNGTEEGFRDFHNLFYGSTVRLQFRTTITPF